MSRELAAEAVPDGTFGGVRPLRRRGGSAPVRPRWTREEQDRHYAQLADAIGAPNDRAPIRRAA